MADIGALRALAQRMERVVPYRLTPSEAREFTTFAQKKYSPMARKISDKEFGLRMKVPEYDEAEQARVKQLIEQLSHEAARYSMLDHAASSIAKARLYGDEDLRARLIRDANGIPGGIATFYPPSHFPGDPLAHGATYVEHLGATGESGQGRVLLRGVGLENPTDPLILQSLNFPETVNFYEARGARRIPVENQVGSALRSLSLPVFKWERGDQVKEKEGGSVKPQKFQVGGLAHYFAKNAPKGLSAMSELGTHSTAPRGALSVVKQKGGNWLNGSVEGALKELKKYTSPEDIAIRKGWLDAPHPDLQQAGELRATIPQISAISPEGVRLVEENAVRLENRGNMQRQQWQEELASLEQRAALNDWITRNLGRYVKNEMATPEDPVRALAERGVLHFVPDEGPGPLARRSRMNTGFDIQGLGLAPLARDWEGVADRSIRTFTPQNILYRTKSISSEKLRQRVEDSTPWIEKLEDKSTPIHDIRPEMYDGLGFDHLIDELANALNPESGLPTRFQIDPAKLHKVSVPQAVQRVHDINQWRAAQKAEADALRANNAATSLVREYPENNPQGLRWVELKANEKQIPEGYVQDPRTKNWYDPFSETTQPIKGGVGPEEEKALQDALKYEGDTMGHCVGGYCDGVLSGRTRIFSLRDAKGQPHVTVEVAPPNRDEYIQANYKDYADMLNEGQRFADSWVDRQLKKAPASIVQIKGKQNRAPNAEYLPFVQDFVRNSPLGGSWSDVGDLQNTGLTKHKTGKYITDAQAAALYEKHFGKLPDSSESAWQYANRIGRYDKNMLTEIDVDFLKDWEAGNFGD